MSILTLSITILLYVLIAGRICFSQSKLQWQECLGGKVLDEGYGVTATSDGGFAVCGSVSSDDGDIFSTYSNTTDAFMIKYDRDGRQQWKKVFGGTGEDVARGIISTSDGGIIVTGYSSSSDGEFPDNHGGYDLWVVRFYDNGTFDWQRSYGGEGDDYGYGITVTVDGYIAVTGETRSTLKPIEKNNGGADVWVLKLDMYGRIIWTKNFGGGSDDIGYSIVSSGEDGNIAIAGMTYRNGGDVFGVHGDAQDAWVIKLLPNGTLVWQKCLGGSNIDITYGITVTSTGNYLVTGLTYSDDGDVSGNKGGSDLWLVQLDQAGSVNWQKCIGGKYNDVGRYLIPTTDGGCVITGHTFSYDGDIPATSRGRSDYIILQCDEYGEVQWVKRYGGQLYDYAMSVAKILDDTYVIAGFTYSDNGDVVGKSGDGFTTDAWFIMVGNTSFVSNETTGLSPIAVYPNPCSDFLILTYDSQGQQPVDIRLATSNGVALSTWIDNQMFEGSNSLFIDMSKYHKGSYILNVDEQSLLIIKQ